MKTPGLCRALPNAITLRKSFITIYRVAIRRKYDKSAVLGTRFSYNFAKIITQPGPCLPSVSPDNRSPLSTCFCEGRDRNSKHMSVWICVFNQTCKFTRSGFPSVLYGSLKWPIISDKDLGSVKCPDALFFQFMTAICS